MQRIRQANAFPADTALYDAFGKLHADADLLTSGSTFYPPIDPLGPGAQDGEFTDEETRGGGASTGLALIGDNYYDPFTGRLVARASPEATYVEGSGWQRFVGGTLAYGLGARFGGAAGGAATLGAFEGLYHLAQGHTGGEALLHGAETAGTALVLGKLSDMALGWAARTAIGRAVSNGAQRALGAALERIGIGSATPVGATLTGTDTVLAEAAARVKPMPGHFDVVIHGQRGTGIPVVIIDGEEKTVNVRSLAAYIRKRGYKGGPIRLISCWAGIPENVTTQQLANKLGARIIAPDDITYITGSGRVVIGPHKYWSTGKWVPFEPGE